MATKAGTEEFKGALRRYISHWAFLPLGQFSDDDSLRAMRVDFGDCSKMGMLVDATWPQDKVVFYAEEMPFLDTVNDFIGHLVTKGVTKLNDPPEGYPWWPGQSTQCPHMGLDFHLMIW